jgi:hypothetical protein
MRYLATDHNSPKPPKPCFLARGGRSAVSAIRRPSSFAEEHGNMGPKMCQIQCAMVPWCHGATPLLPRKKELGDGVRLAPTVTTDLRTAWRLAYGHCIMISWQPTLVMMPQRNLCSLACRTAVSILGFSGLLVCIGKVSFFYI